MAVAKPQFLALTIKANGGRLRELKSACHVCAAFDPTTTSPDKRPRFEAFTAIWDTGATDTVITQRVVDQCGLQPVGLTKVVGAYGGEVERPVYLVNIGLPNNVFLQGVPVSLGEMANCEVILGMSIITLGDFAITNQDGNTLFSFRIPSLHSIDYVRQANQQREAAGRPAAQRKPKRHK